MRTVRTLRLPRTMPRQQARSERMQSGEHQPIAYRADRFRPLDHGGFWISASPDRPGSMLALAPTPFLIHWVRFESLDGFGTVFVFNAHLGHAPWHHGPTARIALEQIDALVRADSGDRSAATDQATSVFLTGDFNAVPSSALLRKLQAGSPSGFVDAARTAPERVGPPVTFHWGMGTVRLGLTLDYVLARTALRPRRAEVIDVHEGRLYPSDHYPLVVEFGNPTSE